MTECNPEGAVDSVVHGPSSTDHPDTTDPGVLLAQRVIASSCIAIAWGGRTRLVVADAGPGSRFRRALHAPAFRRSAIAFRYVLAARALAQPKHLPPVPSLEPRDWLPDRLADLRPISIVVGTPGRAQSLVVRLASEAGNTRCIAKIAVATSGSDAIDREVAALRDPGVSGHAPELIDRGVVDGHASFITTFEPGRIGSLRSDGVTQAARVVPQADALSPAHHVSDHPWVRRVLRQSGLDADVLAHLVQRPVPVVRTHGDMAPWNLLVKRDGSVIAIDWESSEPDGVPGTDLAHHVMATLRFIRRLLPAATVDSTIDTLRRHAGMAHGTALVCTTLAAAQTRLREREVAGSGGDAFWDDALGAALQRVAEAGSAR